MVNVDLMAKIISNKHTYEYLTDRDIYNVCRKYSYERQMSDAMRKAVLELNRKNASKGGTTIVPKRGAAGGLFGGISFKNEWK